jgi:hypothetical protein
MTDSAPTEQLTTRQQKALIALLNEDSAALRTESSGVPERTIYLWLKQSVFDAAYREARRQAVGQAVAHAQRQSGAAVAVLVAIMNDGGKPSAVRVSAAAKVIELSIKAVELEDLQARLEVLEERYATKF